MSLTLRHLAIMYSYFTLQILESKYVISVIWTSSSPNVHQMSDFLLYVVVHDIPSEEVSTRIWEQHSLFGVDCPQLVCTFVVWNLDLYLQNGKFSYWVWSCFLPLAKPLPVWINTVDREIFTLKIIRVKNFLVIKFSQFRSIREIF